MRKPIKDLTLDEQEELLNKLCGDYKRKFGRPYPPIFGSMEGKIEDVQRCIREDDPYDPICNNRDLVDF